MPPKDLPSYVRWVIDQKPEFRNLEDAVKAEISLQLEERLEQLINSAILAAMPESELDYFEKLLTHGTEQQIQDFCQQNIPDMDELIAGVLLQFRNEYVGG